LVEYLRARHPSITGVEDLSAAASLALITDELRNFGIETLADLEALLSREYLAAREKLLIRSNALGTLREAMMFNNLHRYLERSWRKSWQGFSAASIHLLAPRYGPDTLKNFAEKYGIRL